MCLSNSVVCVGMAECVGGVFFHLYILNLVNFNHFHILRAIGKGAFGKVSSIQS